MFSLSSELEMQKQDFLSKETSCNESKTDLHADMLKTMYEMVTTLAEQTVLMINEEIHQLNILLEKVIAGEIPNKREVLMQEAVRLAAESCLH